MLTGPPGGLTVFDRAIRDADRRIQGTGKSFLLSLFFDLLPTKNKRRWHYHAFTLYLYRRVFLEMEKRRQGLATEHVGNMDRAARRGWKSVFAGGRWEKELDPRVVQTDETIPFISQLNLLVAGVALTFVAVAREMILDYHIL